ncbi:MAG: hypothetical protein COV67_12995 [Nitrospinae bacterium CG11_big_fil_rev_8_21_14_0_20_56_8]|nr:MAG: hypothetical protein COV67_12995 [Nitrospinae bacterium CG11_big_fil_rev_8_21_14_0_20_56_8]
MPNKVIIRIIAGLLFLGATFAPLPQSAWANEPWYPGALLDYFKERMRNDSARTFLPISLAEELALGKEIAIEINRRFGGLLQNDDLIRYLNQVGMNLGRVSSRPDLHYTLGILNADFINAYAIPGGMIFITRGLLAQVRDESELAGVLAHEVAHIARKHAIETFADERKKEMLRVISRQELEDNPATVKNLYAKMKSNVLDRDMGEEMEIEADQIARIMTARLGYDPDGLARYLVRVSRVSPNREGHFQFSPALEKRIKFLEWKSGLDRQTHGEQKSEYKVLAERFRKFINAHTLGTQP